MSNDTNKTYAIHPAIGVARMGNAQPDLSDPSTYFLGPEAPYQVANDGQDYKSAGRIKKQAQRFRIYEFENGVAQREVTLQSSDVEAITWSVRLGNRKAALDTSSSAAGTISAPTYPPPDFMPSVTRNGKVPAGNRKNLCIDTGFCSPQSDSALTTMSGGITLYPSAEDPKTTTVKLGEISTESGSGRLLVFASDGLSQGILNGEFSEHAAFGNAEDTNVFANSDNWYDQIADGPVHAQIKFKNGLTVSLDQPQQTAWAICALPKYAPALNYFTNLEHVAQSAAHLPGQQIPRPSFAKDIYPILRSVSLLQWVSAKGSLGHGKQRQGYYLAQDRLQLMSDNNPSPDSDPYKARQGVFSRIRNPADVPERPFKGLTDAMIKPKEMPQLPGEVIAKPGKEDWALSVVTPLQYQMLEKWRDGDFDPDPDGVYSYVPLSQYHVAEQPAALDSAVLEGTSGTPFYPGIESWNIMQVPELYAAPLRLKSDVQPGDLTMGNALPWQADYLDCNDTWWPVQRPDQVTRDGMPLQPWAPDAWGGGGDDPSYGEMVRNWYRLGFIISTDNGATYEEHEQNLKDPET